MPLVYDPTVEIKWGLGQSEQTNGSGPFVRKWTVIKHGRWRTRAGVTVPDQVHWVGPNRGEAESLQY